VGMCRRSGGAPKGRVVPQYVWPSCPI
jgi:hypothetical protein